MTKCQLLLNVLILLIAILSNQLFAQGTTVDSQIIYGDSVQSYEGVVILAGGKVGNAFYVGDVNGDQLSDFLIIERYYSNQVRNAFICFGRRMESDSILLDDFLALNSSKLTFGDYDDILSAKKLGDINGDGIDDFGIGTGGYRPYNPNEAGYIYVVFGNRGWVSESLDLNSDLNGANGFILRGDGIGLSFGGALDIDKDGVNDFFVQKVRDEVLAIRGQSVYPPILNVDSSVILKVFISDEKENSVEFGSSLFGSNITLEDVNGDSKIDLLFGDKRYGGYSERVQTSIFGDYDNKWVPGPGAIFIVSNEVLQFNKDTIVVSPAIKGKVSGYLSRMHPIAGQIFYFAEDGEGLGSSIALGNFNNESCQDIVVGSPNIVWDQAKKKWDGGIHLKFGWNFMDTISYPDSTFTTILAEDFMKGLLEDSISRLGSKIRIANLNGSHTDELVLSSGPYSSGPSYNEVLDWGYGLHVIFDNLEKTITFPWLINDFEVVGDFNGDRRDDILCHMTNGNILILTDVYNKEASNRSPNLVISDLLLQKGFSSYELKHDEIAFDPDGDPFDVDILEYDSTHFNIFQDSSKIIVHEKSAGVGLLLLKLKDILGGVKIDSLLIRINAPPQLEDALDSLIFATGFGKENIEIIDWFVDPEGGGLVLNEVQYDFSFSEINFNDSTLQIIEAAEGKGEIKIEISDKHQGITYHSFFLIVSEVLSLPSKPIALFPNPASSYLRVEEMSDFTSLEFFDLDGKKHPLQLFDNNIFDLSSLKPGIYIIRVNDKNNTQTFKLIKQ